MSVQLELRMTAPSLDPILKWASCSQSGRLTFDTELLRQSADFKAKVIVHELLHLKVPNHGPLFKALLKAYLDRYR